MKKLLLLLYVFGSNQINILAQKKDQINSNWQQIATNLIEQNSYNFEDYLGKQIAVNAKNNLLFTTDGLNLKTNPINENKTFAFTNIMLQNIDKAGSKDLKFSCPTLTKKQDKITYDYQSVVVEYISNAQGLRQNFIVKHKPEGSSNLQLHLKITGDLKPSINNKSTLNLKNKINNKTILQYDDLVVWDATKKLLDATMELTNDNEVAIVVKDENAVYPITVDPLTHSAEWVSSANGVLPTLLTNTQLQIEALYGNKVTALGDVNGDGYDDAAVSAPSAVDVVAGNSLSNVGAVFVYFGSATGLSTVPDRILRPTTPVANALFGFSVTAANVMGNANKDIIVSAPGDSYTATVGGVPNIATVVAGKMYVFNGQDVANNIINVPTSLFLNGAAFFSNGIAGLGSNVATTPLFGFSMGTVDDVDGDGLSEIIVGAPTYADAAAVLVKTGAAFLYRSTNMATNTAIRLNAPNLLNLPTALPSLGGILFGFSVDGAGDYNKDGRPDVVVGTPGGVNLGLSGFLGGSAYVFYGTANSVSNTFGTQLSAGGGLLGSVANLFGYTVKGLTNTSGARVGNILIGAPVGNVLSNLTGGLRLKAGNLNVFTGKANPAATEVPTQQFSSPRSTSILSILNGQNIDAAMLTGAATDNMLDANCDGFADIIVGEPMSTAVGLVNTNAVGGAAYIFTGRPDGTFNTTPFWELENTVSFDAGVNAGSLLGYSVAGIGFISGATDGVRGMVGSPGGALDYSSGILNLGNTLSTTNSFVAGNNGLGKSYSYNFSNCRVLPINLISFDAKENNCNAVLSWKAASSDKLLYTEIQTSSDAINFKGVQKVNKNSNGSYKVTFNQNEKVSYYRLKFVESTGEASFSDARKLTTSCGIKYNLTASPTIFSNTVKLNYNLPTSSQNALLLVTDVYGKNILTQQINANANLTEINFDGKKVAAGVYFVQLKQANYTSQPVRIIKQ